MPLHFHKHLGAVLCITTRMIKAQEMIPFYMKVEMNRIQTNDSIRKNRVSRAN